MILTARHIEQIRAGVQEARGYVIAVDFDGTLCISNWPELGEPNMEIISAVQVARTLGAKIILYTCREGKLLDEALEWCKAWRLTFDAVNDNLPERQAMYGNNPRKIGADEYWDDKAYRV